MTGRQNISGGKGYQVNQPQAPVILGNDNIVNINYSSRLKLGVPFQAPPLPNHYVQRPKQLEAVKSILLAESAPGTLVISAIYGMAGIGKSVLAAALVREQEIQERFPDGVLWVTLGQQPDMLSMVNMWIRALGDYDYNPTTLQASSLHLRTLLADKKALLVIDDVWHPEHVEPFRIGGAGCCVLVTTRQTQIVGAREYDLRLMTPEQSLELLTKYLPTSLTDIERSQAEAFAKEVGYLPLALELAAARIKKGISWDELLTAFQKEMAVLNLDRDVDAIVAEVTRKQRSLIASFKLTLKLLSSQQLEQFAWLGIVPEDVTLTREMGATLWNVASFKSGEILRDFKDQALLLPQSHRPDEKPTYRIHDLVHNLAQNLLTRNQYLGSLPGLGLTVEDAHSQFLERYHAQTTDELWHTVPADGYIHSHLVWHFEQSGQPELMHQLLKESTPDGRNGWYEVCDQLGQIANFVTDITRAWQAAEEVYNQNATESIALQGRYALITTSLNSLAQNIPPELIVALVQKGVWKTAQGLAYVRQKREESQRANGLTKIAPYVPKSLMSEALAIARSIQSKSDRVVALSGLAPYMPEVVRETLAIARSIPNEYYRANALHGLAPYVPESLMSEAVNVARSIQDEYYRADALHGLAQYMSESSMSEALDIARSIEDEYYRGLALRGLSQYMPESLMSEAVAVTQSIQDRTERNVIMCKLAPSLPWALMNKVVTVIDSILRNSHWAKALSTLGQPLPKAWIGKSLDIIMFSSRHSESDRAKALVELAPYLPRTWMSEALGKARSIQNKSYQAKALGGLIPYFPNLVDEVVTVVRSIQQDDDRAETLVEVGQYLPKTWMSEALKSVHLIQSEASRATALVGLAPSLPETLMSEALAIVRSIQDESNRAEALHGLAPYLPDALTSKALAVARSIRDKENQANALSGLVQYLPEAFIGKVFAGLHLNQNEFYRAITLVGLTPYLPEVLMSEALAIVRLMQDESHRAEALNVLAPYLPEVLLSDALATARLIQNEKYRAKALNGLVKYLPDVVSEALAAIRSIQEEKDQAEALRELAPSLPEAFMSEALAVVRSMKDELHWPFALLSLCQHIPDVASEALVMARSLQIKGFQCFILSQLAQYLPDIGSEVLAVTRSMQNEAERINALSSLVKYLPKNLMSEALTIAHSMQNEFSRSCALAELAPYLPDLWSEAFAVASSIQDEHRRAKFLLRYGRSLPETLINEALAMTQSIQYKHDRTLALISLGQNQSLHLSKVLTSEMLEFAASLQDEDDRYAFLSSLVKVLPKDLMSKALTVAHSIQSEHNKAKVLIGLAQALPEASSEALLLVRSIQDDAQRVKYVSELVPTLKTIETDAVVWEEVVHTLAYRDRKAFLADIPKLAPAIISLSGGDTKALELVVEAMRDVCRQWP